MPTVQSGVQNTNTVLSNRKIIDMAPAIELLEDDVAPYTKFLHSLGTKPAKSNKTEWLEDEWRPRKSASAGSSTSGSTIAVTAGEGQFFRVGDVVRACQLGMNFYVTSISTDTLTATRGVGSVADGTIASGEELLIIGNASAEGATLGTIKTTLAVANYNYCTIQRDPLGFTNTEREIALYGGSEPNSEKPKKYAEHMRAIENTLFWGRRNLNTSGSSPIGYAGGLVDYITTNVQNVGGALTQTTFETYLRTAFRYGSSRKVMFCAPIYGAALSSWALGKLQVQSQGQSQKYGLEVSTYTTGLGYTLDVVVKKDWLDFSASSSQIASRAFIVDPAAVEFAPLGSRNTKYLENRQAPDEDSFKAEYLTEYSARVKVERKHMVLYGTTSFS